MAEIDELEKIVMAWLDEFGRDFVKGNDRSAVIVSAAFIHDELRGCLRTFLVDKEDISDRFLDPSNGLLQGFAPMADLAFLLGLIPDQVRKWMKLIAHVRNIFAHSWAMASFDVFDQSSNKDIKKTFNQLREFAIPPESIEGKSELRIAYERLFWCVLAEMDKANKLAEQHQRTACELDTLIPDGMKDWQAVLIEFNDRTTPRETGSGKAKQ